MCVYMCEYIFKYDIQSYWNLEFRTYCLIINRFLIWATFIPISQHNDLEFDFFLSFAGFPVSHYIVSFLGNFPSILRVHT